MHLIWLSIPPTYKYSLSFERQTLVLCPEVLKDFMATFYLTSQILAVQSSDAEHNIFPFTSIALIMAL